VSVLRSRKRTLPRTMDLPSNASLPQTIGLLTSNSILEACVPGPLGLARLAAVLRSHRATENQA